MGERIAYYKSNNNQELKELFVAQWTDFRDWYRHDFIDKDDNLLKKDQAYSRWDDFDKRTLDKLTSTFIGSYCDPTGRGRHLLTLFGPLMNKGRYVKSTELVSGTGNEEFIRLWHFIAVDGRSLQDNTASSAEEYKIGFLAAGEVKELKDFIELFFSRHPAEQGLKSVLHVLAESENCSAGLIASID